MTDIAVFAVLWETTPLFLSPLDLYTLKPVPAPAGAELRPAVRGKKHLATMLAHTQRLIGTRYQKGIYRFKCRFQGVEIPNKYRLAVYFHMKPQTVLAKAGSNIGRYSFMSHVILIKKGAAPKERRRVKHDASRHPPQEFAHTLLSK